MAGVALAIIAAVALAAGKRLSFVFGLSAGPGSLVLLILGWAAAVVVLQALVVVVHEGVHALALKMLCPGHVTFGFMPKKMLAYAACYDWFFMRDAYFFIALAPLVLLSVLFILGMVFTQGYAFVAFAVCFLLNFSGSGGDVLITEILWKYPRTTCVADVVGARMDIYSKKEQR